MYIFDLRHEMNPSSSLVVKYYNPDKHVFEVNALLINNQDQPRKASYAPCIVFVLVFFLQFCEKKAVLFVLFCTFFPQTGYQEGLQDIHAS